MHSTLVKCLNALLQCIYGLAYVNQNIYLLHLPCSDIKQLRLMHFTIAKKSCF